MSKEIKAIVKKPGEPVGRMQFIGNTLENLQRIVGGPIETVPVLEDVICICNEEGKLRNLPPNFVLGRKYPDLIVGTAIICGVDGDELTDLPDDFDLDVWRVALNGWGNWNHGGAGTAPTKRTLGT